MNSPHGRNRSQVSPRGLTRTSLAPKGLTYLPRQEMTNGRIAECEIHCSSASDSWGTPTATVNWPDTTDLQTVAFPAPVKARFVRLVIKSEVKGNPFAAIAELDSSSSM